MYEKFARNFLTIKLVNNHEYEFTISSSNLFPRNHLLPQMALQDETFEEAIWGKRWLKCETWR
jgi:hypothetical protein